jgi:hypothetical protein
MLGRWAVWIQLVSGFWFIAGLALHREVGATLRRWTVVMYGNSQRCEGQRGMKKTNYDEIVVRCRNVRVGPPTFWVLPCVSPSHIPPSSDNKPPTSLWKGEGRMWRRPRF